MNDDRYERYLGDLASAEGMPEPPGQEVEQSGAPDAANDTA